MKNLNVKKKGKGKGKDKPRTCFECNSEAHIARDCPVRAERVAAGGPERLPRALDTEMGNSGGKGNKGKGTKCGGKGGKGYPPKAAWKTYNPDPAVIRPSQWGQWHPGNTKP